MQPKVLSITVLALFLTTALLLPAQNQNISGGLVFEGEPYLAVNPTDPQHMVVAWMGYVFQQPLTIKTKATFDGGQSWSNAVTLPHFNPNWGSADPSIDFDGAGNVYVCYIDYEEPDSGGVYVIRSTDGGLSWNNPVLAIQAQADGSKRPLDRPWFAIDRSGGPYDGHQYLTTKPAPWVPAPNRPYFLRSTDGGTSWQPWRYLDTTNYLVGPYIAAPMPAPVVAADGVFHAVYPSYEPSQNLLPGFFHVSSGDGGATFAYHNLYFGVAGTSDSLAKKGYRLCADPSDPDHLAMLSVINLAGDMDVYLYETTDGGLSWTNPVRVNDDPQGNGKLQDLVWADFDTDGDLVVSWRDRRNAPGSGYQQASEIWGAVLWKDSTSFSPNFEISDSLAAYNHSYLSGAGNDFMTVLMRDDTLSAVWGDVRNGRLNIWFQRMSLRDLTTSVRHNLVSEELPELRVYPNPARDRVRVEGEGLLGVEMLDLRGFVLFRADSSGDPVTISLENVPAGSYFLRVHTVRGIVVRKLFRE